MASKKNTKKTKIKPKKVLKKKSPAKKQASHKKSSSTKAMAAPKKKATTGSRTSSRKPISAKTAPKKPKKKHSVSKSTARGKSQNIATGEMEPSGRGARSGGQSGDLQGLSDVAGADSESVDELLEEGNAFEAEVVEGVQNAPDADQGDITTHEVPENDVPEEYLNKDRL